MFFYQIKKYFLNAHAKAHLGYTIDIVQIFKVSRKDELERFKKVKMDPFVSHFLLTPRIGCFCGMVLDSQTGPGSFLKEGLRIAPPEAPVTGFMFGKGVYFADLFSKSANYCYASIQSSKGVLLLCEVALGDMAEQLSANYNTDQLPEGKLREISTVSQLVLSGKSLQVDIFLS
ncbi:poly [ADP-ribose] polymerase 2-like [Zingiber officinale]|uniref:poly [ADP-ribose] polymerase 2-like n=1 Tax=Zingiber officinale TaxID=94328 RepID=UPI001C4A7A25|nr:poly [ADP-ribose] polymerase 2-like [Zingiber officinale]